ncbi:hypothetical protein Ciccas_007812 [Cichlidogyrus casuarinus]|uniref:Uncharacterized protein n=1 Tax=Cichlidogyrus casuarinus TaxID=1844966 RepID=A0ABD2Q4F3_9PLAT
MEEVTSIASTAVNNAMNIVHKDRLSTEAATNLAIEKVDLGGTALPEAVLRAAGVPMDEFASQSANVSVRRRSSQASIARTSHSRSPPPPTFYLNQEMVSQNMESGVTSDLNGQDDNVSPPLTSSPQSPVRSPAPLAEAVANAICLQHGVDSKLIQRSTSAATSYMASDEDNSQDDAELDEVVSSRRRNRKLASNIRKRCSVHQNNPDDASTNQESGYGASNFSITSSGRSSVGAHSLNCKSSSAG